MSDPANGGDFSSLSQLLQLGGNGAAMAGVYIAWQAYKGLLSALDRLARGFTALQRAIAVSNPRSAAVIEEHERDEETRLTTGK